MTSGTIRTTILERATQTNEVGRLATLYPAFSSLVPNGDGRSLALLEVGASAGLCLYPDRYLIRWRFPNGGTQETDPVGPLLECATTGELPGWALAPVVWRAGIDLAPVDVTDDDAVRWLETMVWPEQEERRERLRAAVRIARADPPYLVQGDLLEALPALMEQAPPEATLVVFHSAVIAYLEPADRERFAAMMAGLVADGRCHWVSNEGPRVLPGLVPPGRRTSRSAGSCSPSTATRWPSPTATGPRSTGCDLPSVPRQRRQHLGVVTVSGDLVRRPRSPTGTRRARAGVTGNGDARRGQRDRGGDDDGRARAISSRWNGSMVRVRAAYRR